MDGDTSDGNGDGSGLLDAIGSIVEALADAQREGRGEIGGAGRHPSGHFTTEYGYAGRIGIRDGDVDAGGGGGGSSDARATDDERADEEDAYRVDVRYDEDDDELLVVADLPEVSADEVDAGLDPDANELVIQVDDRTVDRLELPWPVEDVDGRFRHGILELRFTPADATD